jgi:hypothetical protein
MSKHSPEAIRVAKLLSASQSRALVECTPWDVCVGTGIAIAFCVNGLLDGGTIVADGAQLTSLGNEVRAVLKEGL